MPTPQFPFGGGRWKRKMLSVMTSRQPGINWIRQSLGAALLRSGRAAEAEPVFREGLRRSPRNPRLLFGLWKCLEAQGRSSGAGWVQREFAASWRGGDDLHIEEF